MPCGRCTFEGKRPSRQVKTSDRYAFAKLRKSGSRVIPQHEGRRRRTAERKRQKVHQEKGLWMSRQQRMLKERDGARQRGEYRQVCRMLHERWDSGVRGDVVSDCEEEEENPISNPAVDLELARFSAEAESYASRIASDFWGVSTEKMPITPEQVAAVIARECPASTANRTPGLTKRLAPLRERWI